VEGERGAEAAEGRFPRMGKTRIKGEWGNVNGKKMTARRGKLCPNGTKICSKFFRTFSDSIFVSGTGTNETVKKPILRLLNLHLIVVV
jgi:hypothetical protein